MLPQVPGIVNGTQDPAFHIIAFLLGVAHGEGLPGQNAVLGHRRKQLGFIHARQQEAGVPGTGPQLGGGFVTVDVIEPFPQPEGVQRLLQGRHRQLPPGLLQDHSGITRFPTRDEAVAGADPLQRLRPASTGHLPQAQGGQGLAQGGQHLPTGAEYDPVDGPRRRAG